MTLEVFTILLAGIGTLAIFSFLIRENPFYRFFEHLFIGISAGLLPIYTIKNLLWPKIIGPMVGDSVRIFPDGTYAEPYNSYYLLYLAPLLFGLLYYFTFSKRHGWLAKVVIGFSLGYSAGLSFKGFFAEVTPQVTSSFKALVVSGASGIEVGESINNTIFVFTLLTVMYYFFFTFRRGSRGGDFLSTAGRWLMMVCFGAFFGSTVMARMALLVERLQFLLTEWIPALRGFI